jgi:hypothetical protein
VCSGIVLVNSARATLVGNTTTENRSGKVSGGDGISWMRPARAVLRDNVALTNTDDGIDVSARARSSRATGPTARRPGHRAVPGAGSGNTATGNGNAAVRRDRLRLTHASPGRTASPLRWRGDDGFVPATWHTSNRKPSSPASQRTRPPPCPAARSDRDDLIWHLAEVQLFWGAIVRDRLDDPDAAEKDKPSRPEDHPPWWRCSAMPPVSRSARSTTPPETEVWTWADDHTAPSSSAARPTRQLIHRLAELVAGEVTELGALASDGRRGAERHVRRRPAMEHVRGRRRRRTGRGHRHRGLVGAGLQALLRHQPQHRQGLRRRSSRSSIRSTDHPRSSWRAGPATSTRGCGAGGPWTHSL